MFSQLPIRSCPTGAFHCAKHHRLQRLDHSTGDASAVDNAFDMHVFFLFCRGKYKVSLCWDAFERLYCKLHVRSPNSNDVSEWIDTVDGRNISTFSGRDLNGQHV